MFMYIILSLLIAVFEDVNLSLIEYYVPESGCRQ